MVMEPMVNTINHETSRQQSHIIKAPLLLTVNQRMLTILKMAEVVAAHNTPVLIEGESGTGKEVLARFIHTRSQRRLSSFVALNCAAIPDNLLESELFGYEKGAFTGADRVREGKFELASGGTIVLDEISEMNPALQVKLLRVLQEREVDRLGGSYPIPVDVRTIATTNTNLKEWTRKGRFREDLYYRINVFPLRLPPLRDRMDDLSVLVPHFVTRHSGGLAKEVSREAYDKMRGYYWPGNIRELENAIARAALISHECPRIEAEHLVFDGVENMGGQNEEAMPVGVTLREMEKRLIIRTLKTCNGNRTHAAKALDISVRTLRNKLNEYRHNNELSEDLKMEA